MLKVKVILKVEPVVRNLHFLLVALVPRGFSSHLRRGPSLSRAPCRQDRGQRLCVTSMNAETPLSMVSVITALITIKAAFERIEAKRIHFDGYTALASWIELCSAANTFRLSFESG